MSGRQRADKGKARGPRERTQKSIVFEVLPDAIGAERDTLSGLVDARGLFYAVRRLYLNHPERPVEGEKKRAETKKNPEYILDYEYFCHKIIPAYEQDHGEIVGLTIKAIGRLYEAHTPYDGEPRMIGTELAARYQLPSYYFDKCLYVEKDGIARTLVGSGLGRRYDMAILGSQGYGTEADRDILLALDAAGYPILVLHDCDIDGFGILANLRYGNQRKPGMRGEVIDLGMRLDDARSLSLMGEEDTRKKAIPETTVSELTHEELELLTGVPVPGAARPTWRFTRYELNEIPSEERVPFVERKLEEAGLDQKVMPPDDYLDAAADVRIEADIEAEAGMAIDEFLADEIKAAMVERFTDRYDKDGLRQKVEDGLVEQPRSSWRAVLGPLISDQGTELRAEIQDAVREYLPSEDEDDE